MARILGVQIPDNKRLVISLTYIHGVGTTTAQKVVAKLNLDPSMRVKTLTEAQLDLLRGELDSNEYLLEGDAKKIVWNNIKRLREIKCYKGTRHAKGLPVHGQRTRTNARTRKGKRKTA